MDYLYLEIPNMTHQSEYERVMDRWEQLEENIQPELMRRGNSPYKNGLNFVKMTAQRGQCYQHTSRVRYTLC